MKTKIIYISGNEVFDMADIRAAFDTVRSALGLDNETILFGVPVDNDDALASDGDLELNKARPANTKEPVVSANNDNIIEPMRNDEVPATEDTKIEIAQEETITPIEKPKKTSRRATAKVVPITSAKPDIADEKQDDDEKPAIPILSVLGTKANDDVTDIQPDVTEPIDNTPISIAPIEPVLTSDKPAKNTITDTDTQTVSINDMLADDTVPVDTREKTLEELLETITPLGEDKKSDSVAEPEPEIEPVIEESTDSSDDTDATLELLATEFAESEDKIVTPTKTETRGKIGKLKNILPFKKAKRDDSGIMGDLFGWAGVANDEDFTIPGFFTNASSKK